MSLNGLGPKSIIAPRTNLQQCQLCGQQFGTASIGMHTSQCYAKRLAQWEVESPASRGSKPQLPDTINLRGSISGRKRLGIDHLRELETDLSASVGFDSTTFSERSTVKQRTLKGSPSMRPPNTSTSGRAKAGNGLVSTRRTTTSRSKSGYGGPARQVGMRPVLPSCYLCGQQFGTTSIGIHVPQCYAKKLAQWEIADPATRGSKPKHPDVVNWRGKPGTSVEEQSEMQFKEFLNHLESCPNCGRKFLADRLVVHLRSCRPGNTSKPLGPVKKGAESDFPIKTALVDPSRLSFTSLAVGYGKAHPNAGSGRGEPAAAAATTAKGRAAERQSPGLPKDKLPHLLARSSQPNGGRTCRHCMTVEPDSGAKFCRECGWNLNTENMLGPCKRCGELIPDKSRYCSTCGEPVANAAGAEREPGWCNENAPTVHMSACPGCKALCCDDANFCDNCGAVLGEQGGKDMSLTSTHDSGASYMMYCKKCNVSVAEANAVFCEDCGGTLEKRAGAEAAKNTDALNGSVMPPPKGTVLPRVDSLSVRKAAPPEEEWVSEEEGGGVREPCPSCGRQFAPEVLQKHIRRCASHSKRRPVFNINKKWLEGLGTVPRKTEVTSNTGNNKGASASPKKNWKAESEAFRRALREAKQVDRILKSGGNVRDLPPPTYSDYPDYVPCPYCQRRFAPKVAERHIPHCATTINKPKPPPKRKGV